MWLNANLRYYLPASISIANVKFVSQCLHRPLRSNYLCFNMAADYVIYGCFSQIVHIPALKYPSSVPLNPSEIGLDNPRSVQRPSYIICYISSTGSILSFPVCLFIGVATHPPPGHPTHSS